MATAIKAIILSYIYFTPQVGGEIENRALMNVYSQVEDVFQIPWGHHKVIMDNVKGYFIII